MPCKVKEEVERREKAMAKLSNTSSGFFGRFWGDSEARDLLSNEEKKSLLNDLQDVNKATVEWNFHRIEHA